MRSMNTRGIAVAVVTLTLAILHAAGSDLGAAGQAWVRRERSWAANGPRYRAAYERIVGPLG